MESVDVIKILPNLSMALFLLAHLVFLVGFRCQVRLRVHFVQLDLLRAVLMANVYLALLGAPFL
jgi:ABC-type multidrug transport system permease subunit